MDLNNRAALELLKVQGPPCDTYAPFEPVAEKAVTVTPGAVDKAPEKTFAPDSSTRFAKLATGKVRHGDSTDNPVFSQGDPADAVFYIQSGKVRLTVQSVDGERAVLTILSEGSFFGECCLAGQAVRSATASALLRSTLVRIEKQTMMDLLRSDPEFAERFRTYVLSRSICMEVDLVSHLHDFSEKRLARMRGMKPKFRAEWKPIPVTSKMSPELMAEIIGTTSSNVNFLLDGFRELGFIDSSGDEMLVHGSLMSILRHDDTIC